METPESPADRIALSKYHGLGNDFILVYQTEISAGLAAAMCDRRFGVGADGVIQIDRSDGADFSFRLTNSDGSAAEVSGNGLRCVGKYLFEKGLHRSTSLTVEAGGRVKQLDLHVEDGTVTAVKAGMGQPEDLGEIELNGMTFRRIVIGNPHAVTFVPDAERAPVTEVGPRIERDVAFPNRTNVEFVQVDGDDLHVRFWERGAGLTLASGSGSCAALAASGLSRATVHTPGGDLLVEKDGEGGIFMTGPAVHVFDATLGRDWYMTAAAGPAVPLLEKAPL